MFNITVGTNTRAHGICCIALGDNVLARGAYQVVIGEKLTIPNDLTKANAVVTLNEIKEMKLTFQAMVDQKVAPVEFGSQSSKAIDLLTAALEKHFGKNLEGLLEDVKKEALVASGQVAVPESKGKEKEAPQEVSGGGDDLKVHPIPSDAPSK